MAKRQAMTGGVDAKKASNIAKHRAERLEKMDAKETTRVINTQARENRSPVQQIAELDFRLGKDAGAVKERLRLMGGA